MTNAINPRCLSCKYSLHFRTEGNWLRLLCCTNREIRATLKPFFANNSKQELKSLPIPDAVRVEWNFRCKFHKYRMPKAKRRIVRVDDEGKILSTLNLRPYMRGWSPTIIAPKGGQSSQPTWTMPNRKSNDSPIKSIKAAQTTGQNERIR